MLLKRTLAAFLTLCVLVCLISGCKTQLPHTDPVVDPPSPEPTSPTSPKVLLGPPEMGLELISKMFQRGITGCWRLSDGTLLLEGPEGCSQQYARFYPQYDGARLVVASEWRCTVQKIGDSTITFIGAGWNGWHTYPFLWEYDLKTGRWFEQQRVDAPVTYGFRSGIDLPENGTSISGLGIRDNSVEVEIAFESPNPDDARIYFDIRSDSEARQLVMEIPYARVGPTLRLPLSIDGTQGLIRSIRAERGTVRTADAGLTVYVTLDSEKWEHLTYSNYIPPREDAGSTPIPNPKITLFIYEDRVPTDLTIEVPR